MYNGTSTLTRELGIPTYSQVALPWTCSSIGDTLEIHRYTWKTHGGFSLYKVVQGKRRCPSSCETFGGKGVRRLSKVDLLLSRCELEQSDFAASLTLKPLIEIGRRVGVG